MPPRRFTWSPVWGIGLAVWAALSAIPGFSVPAPLYVTGLGISGGGFLLCHLLESHDTKIRDNALSIRDEKRDRQFQEMRRQLAEVHVATFRQAASLAPTGLRKIALELSSDILNFVIDRQSTSPTPSTVHLELSKKIGEEARNIWQAEWSKQLGTFTGQSFAEYDATYRKRVEEMYRRMQAHGLSDPLLEGAMNAYPILWPDDVYTIGEQLGKLAEQLP